jgi:UTP--glucose-1-phosphate uridylyltransferase
VKQSVRIAVFPAAGLGTRFLPATKTMPKEMLPLVDKPIIQYAVEEAVASGIEQVVLVTARGKTAMVDHFDVDVELETFLEDRGKIEQLAAVRHASTLVRLGAVRQGPPLGLGHAVLITRDLVGDQPFAVVLGDDVIHADPPAIRQLVDVYDKVQGPVIAVERVPMDQISRYGVVDAEPMGDGVYRIKDLVEKPPREEAPSDLGIIGRYVLTPDIFDVLANVREDRTGEIQLTNGLRELLKRRPLYACEVKGTRHDTGNKLGFLQATFYFAMQRPDIAEPLKQYIRTLLEQSESSNH